MNELYYIAWFITLVIVIHVVVLVRVKDYLDTMYRNMQIDLRWLDDLFTIVIDRGNEHTNKLDAIERGVLRPNKESDQTQDDIQQVKTAQRASQKRERKIVADTEGK